MDVSFVAPISNLSFFFNTLQANGTLFELRSSSTLTRFARALTRGHIIGKLVNGRFRLIVIDNQATPQEFEVRDTHRLNDGRPHQIQLDLENNRLIVDGIYNVSMTKIDAKLRPNRLQLIGDRSLDGWLQDLRINNQPVPVLGTSGARGSFNVTSYNVRPLIGNPCYPENPCQNKGVCYVTTAHDYL